MPGWTLKGQYLNLLIFLCGLATTIIGPLTDWADIGSRFSPGATVGYIAIVAAYLRSINTERPRESYQERRTDPPADRQGDPPKSD